MRLHFLKLKMKVTLVLVNDVLRNLDLKLGLEIFVKIGLMISCLTYRRSPNSIVYVCLNSALESSEGGNGILLQVLIKLCHDLLFYYLICATVVSTIYIIIISHLNFNKKPFQMKFEFRATYHR